MATDPFDPTYIGANLFDIYTDTTARSPTFNLPGGACNFVDLSLGAHGVRCGCRRFWTRQVLGGPGLDQTGWCMCNHHACYHDDGQGQPQAQAQYFEATSAGQENERPRTGRAPLSPVVVDLVTQPAAAVPDSAFPSFGSDPSLSFINNQVEETNRQSGIPKSSGPGSSMPDTLNWGEGLLSQRAPTSTNPNTILPPIPSQCLMPSQTASTTSSVQLKYMRPFAGKGLHTLAGPNSAKQRSAPDVPRSTGDSPATPQRQLRSAADDSFVFVSPDGQAPETPGSGTATQAEPRANAAAAARDTTESGAVTRQVFRNLSDTVSGHEQRLDRLETVSFSGAGHDDCHDKYDQMDLRTTDIESRLEDVEKLLKDDSSVAPFRVDKSDEAAGQSLASASSGATGATGQPMHSQDFYSQLQMLQAQVNQIQSTLPSHGSPWEVEVVFLPFPMKKLWQESHLFNSDVSISSDDWTQLPMSHSATSLRSQSPFTGEWTGPEHDAHWLLPKACGDGSLTDRRLRSRGLVRTISVHGPDARSVQIAMNSAFADAFREMGMMDRPRCSDPHLSKFLGLQSTWVPLRKIHKNSRLRFLSPAEMMTPATWDVQFLHSVMMRSSEPRLFITHPDGYLQDYEAYEAGWSWQRLRELPPFDLDVAASQQGQATALSEEFWSWNESLDEPQNVHVALGQRHSRRRVSASPSLPSAGFAIPHLTNPGSSLSARRSSPMPSGRRASRPPHIRTTSLPVAEALARSSPGPGRRRVVSHGQSRRASPSVRLPSQTAVMKRRRARSPSYPRYTPRWTASPSPMPLGLRERSLPRGTTPVAYATPHSNAPLQEVRTRRGSSVVRIGGDLYAYNDRMDHDELYDIEIYESASDGAFDDGEGDESMESDDLVTHAQPNPDHNSQIHRQLPEDEPWPGIEDQEHMSDGENVDPHQEDHRSDASSQPSEYPSTQRPWPDEDVAFDIHEDANEQERQRVEEP